MYIIKRSLFEHFALELYDSVSVKLCLYIPKNESITPKTLHSIFQVDLCGGTDQTRCKYRCGFVGIVCLFAWFVFLIINSPPPMYYVKTILIALVLRDIKMNQFLFM